jgi:hypothetical protein
MSLQERFSQAEGCRALYLQPKRASDLQGNAVARSLERSDETISKEGTSTAFVEQI